MKYELYQKLDEWTIYFNENRKYLSKEIKRFADEHNTERESLLIRLKIGKDIDFISDVTIVIHPGQMIEMNGVTNTPAGKGFSKPGENVQIQYRCLVKRIDGQAKVVFESVMLVHDGSMESASPGLKMSDVLRYFSDEIFMGESDAKAKSLPIESLNELMQIQEKVMKKEKDLKGIIDMKKAYADLSRSFPSQ